MRHSNSEVHVYTCDIWITYGSISIVCFLSLSLFGFSFLSLGIVSVDTVYDKNVEALDEAVLLQRGSCFFLVGR